MKTAVFTATLFLSAATLAQETEFYLNFENCRSVVGYLELGFGDNPRVTDGVATTMACWRSGSTISCSFEFEGGGRSFARDENAEQYEIIIDIPPLLHMRTENGSEYIAIDTVGHAATIITRLAGAEFIGSKVCTGLYVTAMEYEALREQ